MDGRALPNEIKGQWIWLGQEDELPESYVFFRREFSLDGIPSSAELWITARSFFHVYINGHHLGYALGTAPGRSSYVWNYDIAYLLATGVNSIAVLAHNTEVARTSCNRQPAGLWCQFEIDGAPLVWSDHSWQALSGACCYSSNRPRRSSSSGFSERVDLASYPHGWQSAGFGGTSWRHPDMCEPYDRRKWDLQPFPAPEFTAEARPIMELSLTGTWRRTVGTTHVLFDHLARRNGSGVYAAETYLYAEEDADLIFEFFADNPYRLFVNGVPVKEQGLRPLAIGTSFLSCKSLCFRQGETADPVGQLGFVAGWNRINVFMDVEAGTAGATLVLPSLSPSQLRVKRMPDDSALPGWAVTGPIRTPMVNVLGNLTVAGAEHKEYFVPIEELPVDEAVELTMFDYMPGPAPAADAAGASDPWREGVSLKQGEYAIVSLDRTVFGCPHMFFRGNPGDVVDVVTGTEITEGQVIPIDGMREHVDTVLLADAETAWMGCFPKAVRHVMVVARVVKSGMTFLRPAVHCRRFAFDNSGVFESSDPILDRIWQVGKNTLDATVQEVFIDSPAKDQTQYVPDAFIESWASYFVYGNYTLAARALAEFAVSQFETGELPAASPGGVYLNIPDFSLLWPVWLRHHYMCTGDRKLLDQLLPAAERLFAYFEEITDPETGVLNDLGRHHKAFCFLDHGAIDRRGVITGLNALYCRALLSGAWLFETVNREELAELLRQRLNRVVLTLRELTWDEERQLFADSWYHGRRSQEYSMQTNVLAIYGGLALPEQYDAIFDAVFIPEAPFEATPSGDTDNPYFKYFVLETAFALGRREWAFNYMKWYWGSMLDNGASTWWELFNPLAEPTSGTGAPGSTCHGYGTSPNGFLIREVAGVRPAIPGYSAIYFNPLLGAVKSVKTKIPTRYGHIKVEWEIDDAGKLDVAIAATYPLAVIPELDPAIAATTTMRVADEVSIFAEQP